MKKVFIVKINIALPYPKEFEYRQHASSAAVAVKRALDKLHKDTPHKRIARWHIDVIQG